MATTVRQVAEWVNGDVIGDPDLMVQAARPLTSAQSGDVTYVEGRRNLAQLSESPATVVIAPLNGEVPGKTLIRVKDPLWAFITVVERLHALPAPPPPGIDPAARIHPTATVGPDCRIEPFAFVGEGAVIGARCVLASGVVVGRFCKLGDDVHLNPNVVLYDRTILGHRVIIHANAVIGADGFGYRLKDGRHVKIPQLGHVEIGDDVEIGACTTIDRAAFDATRIGAGTKIDNLVMIGHNCRIGRHNLIISQVGIAGSCSTGDYVVMAGQAGLADHLHVGDRAILGAQAGVMEDVPAGGRVLGAPAMPEREIKHIFAAWKRLPKIRQDVRRVLRHLGLSDHDDVDAAA